MTHVLQASVIFEKENFEQLSAFLSQSKYSQYFILVDENTKIYCLPEIKTLLENLKIPFIELSVAAGESSKSLEVCGVLWSALTKNEADRKSLLINLGGGMITDLGGFVASVYKRGINFINVPTSLLAMVDASVGGKCGIDFENFKNQLGVFNEPEKCFIQPVFLSTLPEQELISGYAEVLKHSMISNQLDAYELGNIRKIPTDEIIEKAIVTKAIIVQQDPFERGERKKLNFGHTIGHAVESYFLQHKKAIPHGYAVVVGMACELFISVRLKLIRYQVAEEYVRVMSFFPKVNFRKEEIEQIMPFLKQDKKNENGQLKFTLLNGKNSAIIDQEVEQRLIEESLEHYIKVYGLSN